MSVRNSFLIALAATAVLCAPPAHADDWPQWMGPKRDNVWRETGVVEKFPAGGPKVLWRTPVGGGYTGPAVAGGKVYVMDKVLAKGAADPADPFDTKSAVGSTERVLCLDQKTGKILWTVEYDCPYQISYPGGPRCTPLVADGKVYTLGAMGNLYCLDAASGKEVWKVDFKAAYKAKPAIWGFAAHPILDGKNLITLVGGESHVVAFDKDTGKEVWKSKRQADTGYSPVLFTEAGGRRQMVVASPKAVYALDPATGDELWSTPFSADNGCVVMTPVRAGDHVFVGAYNRKNLLLKLTTDKPGVEVVWKDKKDHGMSPVNVQPFLEGGVLYGYDDSGNMYAVELPSGKRLWEGDGPVGHKPMGSETAFMVKNGDRFYFFADSGDLVVGKLTPDGYEEISRAKVLDQTNTPAFGRKVVWCAPAYADRKAYVRNDKEIICIDLAK